MPRPPKLKGHMTSMEIARLVGIHESSILRRMEQRQIPLISVRCGPRQGVTLYARGSVLRHIDALREPLPQGRSGESRAHRLGSAAGMPEETVRNNLIVLARKHGATYRELGKAAAISRQRAEQIVRRAAARQSTVCTPEPQDES